jgi:hypothetical protein
MLRYFLFCLLILFITGCSSSVTVGQSPTYTTVIKTGSPNLQETISPPESGPTAIIPTRTIPVPKKETGVVTGVLHSIPLGSAPPKVAIYLGEYMYLTPGPDYMLTIRQMGSSNATTDENGHFVIDNVPPGDYPLIAWTPFTSYVITAENGDKELIVHVEAGEVMDLGLIEINWP